MFWKKDNKKSSGNRGEDLAVDYLRSKKFGIIKRNFKNEQGRQIGEIDIVAEKGGTLVFVEVKTRVVEKVEGTLPEENITSSKLRKLQKIAEFYVKKNNLWNMPFRFDAISVWLNKEGKKLDIKHIENMFL